MRLAEALLLRADLNARLAQTRERALRVARVQEGDPPAEDPAALMAEHARMAGELEGLIAAINRTNLAVTLASGVTTGGLTMTGALARRDAARLRTEFLRTMAATAAGSAARQMRSEIRFVATVDVSAVQAEADGLSRGLRDLDGEIQAANWTNDLLE